MGRDHKHHQRKRPYYPRESVREQALVAQGKDLEEQMDSALALLHRKEMRIADLTLRLERAVDANQMLRVEYDGLLLILDSQEVQ